MRTTKLISNISYNTDAYFSLKISELMDNHIIDYAYWIRHLPDTDDTKSHIHFVMKPSVKVDTNGLKQYFDEFDPKNLKPLSCTSVWRTSKIDDWLLYAVHDTEYLRAKGLERTHYDYSFDEIGTTDSDALRSDWFMIDRGKYKRLKAITTAVHNGTPFYELVKTAQIPIAQRAQYERQYLDELSHIKCDKDGVIIEE